MNAQEAKALSIEVWEYLAAHPEITWEADLPSELYGQIHDFWNHCPICTLYKMKCEKCSVSPCPWDDNGEHGKWRDADNAEIRREAAMRIVEILKAWKPELRRENDELRKQVLELRRDLETVEKAMKTMTQAVEQFLFEIEQLEKERTQAAREAA